MGTYFITGIGTGVGKTHITAGLIKSARSNGLTVKVQKPLISGYDPNEENDLSVLGAALDLPSDQYHKIAHYHFKAPLSPDIAAKLEKQSIDIDSLLNKTKSAIDDSVDLNFIEGVGGSHVPLAPNYLVADWIKDIGVPAIVIGSDYLGALSHTITCLHGLAAKSVDVKALVISEAEEPAMDIKYTIESLRNQGISLPIFSIPRSDQQSIDIESLLYFLTK